ncbi:MAG TPA: sialidase family protein, partial [Candidatus Limnocylindrales bacterium]|nr:sialidase family protein [Candidatus Limnocylindrales bacterium]
MAGSRRLALACLSAIALIAAAIPTVALAAPPAPKAPPPGPTQLGFCSGDDWEPELAHQGSTVYAVITHYPTTNACDPSASAPNSIDIQKSTDGGRTWTHPSPVFTGSVGGVSYPAQADPIVEIDASGHVFVSFLGYGNSGGHTDVIVAKSTDGGTTWTAAKANAKDCKNCDHPKMVITSAGIYLAYSQATNHFMALSTDGGSTWTQADVLTNGGNVAFAEGIVADSSGNVYTAWGDCLSSNCTGTPAAIYRVSKTPAGQLTSTTFVQVATGAQGPACPFSKCGFAFFGAQDDIGIDGAGTLYLAWQDGQVPTNRGGPTIVNVSRSTDHGATWSLVGRADDKAASG